MGGCYVCCLVTVLALLGTLPIGGVLLAVVLLLVSWALCSMGRHRDS